MKLVRSLFLALFLAVSAPVMFTACSTTDSGQVESPSFTQVLGQAFLTVEVIGDLTSQAFLNGQITIEKAVEIESQLTVALDALVTIKDVGLQSDSMSKLDQVRTVLLKLEQELRKYE